MRSSAQTTSLTSQVAAGNPSVVIDAAISDAFAHGASDLHIELEEAGIRITERLHGSLTTRHLLPAKLHASVVAQLKVRAGLRTDEHSVAQDGGFSLDGGSRSIRVSLIPARLGEKATLRLIDASQAPASLEDLGVPHEVRTGLGSAISRGHGLILIAGATGTGKSSTLRALLRICIARGSGVVSIEDPIEYVIPGVTQIPVTPFFGFAHALRSVLRQDPDVIAIGEVRDMQSADLCCQAALTGHLVLATIHAASADDAHDRMARLGVPSATLEQCVRGILYQRLEPVRCSSACAELACVRCGGTGVIGRAGHFSWKALGVFSPSV